MGQGVRTFTNFLVGWTGFVGTVNQSMSKVDLEGFFFSPLNNLALRLAQTKANEGDTFYTSLMVRSEGMKLIELDDDM